MRIKQTLTSVLLALLFFMSIMLPTMSAESLQLNPKSKTSQEKQDHFPNDINEYQIWKEQKMRTIQKNTGLFSPSTATNQVHNNFVEYYVNNEGRFTIGTVEGNPDNPNDNNKKLLYGHPGSGTSYTTFKIDGKDFIFKASNSESLIDTENKTHTTEYTTGDINIKQVLKIVPNNSTTREDIIEVKYIVTNKGTVPHNIGSRIMLDTMLGDNDYAPFRLPNLGAITKELELSGNEIPEYWLSFDNLTNPSVISQGTLSKSLTNKPDKIQFANWSKLYDSPFSYQVNSSNNIGDSAVGIYWNEKTIPVGEKREYVTHYGISEFTQDLRPPLALSVTGATSVNSDSDGYNPNPITVTAFIENNGNAEAKNTKVKLNLSSGLSVVEGQIEQDIGNLNTGFQKQISWKVKIKPEFYPREETYSVTVQADGVEPKTSQNRNIQIPSYKGSADKIVFIPGIMGTSLYDTQGNKEKIWIPDTLEATKRLKLMEMNTEGQPVHKLNVGKPDEDFYNKIINELQTKYGDENVIVFGYDWRLNIDENVKLLQDTLKDTETVSIVAHSMGGLLASKYIENGNEKKVNKLITLGTPYLGAPKALLQFETGKVADDIIKDFVIADKIKQIAPNMISPYQLLPSDNYFNYNNTYYVQMFLDNNWPKKNTRINFLTFNNTLNWLKNVRSEWVNSSHLETAKQFHSSLDLLSDSNGLYAVDSYMIIGDQIKTPGLIIEEFNEKKNGYDYAEVDDIEPINGDGTVPVISADIGGQTPPTHTYYIKENHSKLPSNDDVVKQVISILNNNPQSININKITHNATNTRSLKLKIECPVDLHIYDNNNNHMGPISKTSYEEQITGSTYYQLGDKKIALLEDQNYQVKLIGTDNGTMTYTLQWYDEQNHKEKTIRFDNITITPTTIITTHTNDDDKIELLVDENKDGITDKHILPTVILDKQGSQDVEEPTTSYKVNGPMGLNNWYLSDVELQLSGQDNSSGINKIEYTINDSNISTYEKPILLQKEGTHSLIARAIDHNKNESDPVTISIKIDKQDPTIKSTLQDKYKSGTVLNTKNIFTIEDKDSGIANIKYSLNKDKLLGQEIKLTKPGTNVIEVLVEDNAGRTKKYSKTIDVYDDNEQATTTTNNSNSENTNTPDKIYNNSAKKTLPNTGTLTSLSTILGVLFIMIAILILRKTKVKK